MATSGKTRQTHDELLWFSRRPVAYACRYSRYARRNKWIHWLLIGQVITRLALPIKREMQVSTHNVQRHARSSRPPDTMIGQPGSRGCDFFANRNVCGEMVNIQYIHQHKSATPFSVYHKDSFREKKHGGSPSPPGERSLHKRRIDAKIRFVLLFITMGEKKQTHTHTTNRQTNSTPNARKRPCLSRTRVSTAIAFTV